MYTLLLLFIEMSEVAEMLTGSSKVRENKKFLTILYILYVTQSTAIENHKSNIQ